MTENGQTKILLVDDLPENLLALESLLEGLECTIHTAQSGKEALLLVLKNDYALVLLDVQMPEMDGFEVAEMMRSSKKTQHIPIIFVTAISTEKKYFFKGYEVGAVDYMTKPIDPDILKSKVLVFLQLNQQKRLLEKQTQELEDEITQRKEFEDVIQKAHIALLKANKQKSEFLQFLSTELRSPLSMISGFFSLAQQNLNTNNIAKTLEILQHAQQTTRNLQLLVSDVVDFSQLETGKMELAIEEFSLNEVIEECLFLVAELIKTKPIEIVPNLATDLPLVENDYVLVKKVIQNLLSFIIRFLESGQIDISIAKSGDTIIAVEIKETNRIIPVELLQVVSDPIEYTDMASEEKFTDASLALVLTKKFCESIGIEILILNDAPHGSTFQLNIPIKFPISNITDPSKSIFLEEFGQRGQKCTES